MATPLSDEIRALITFANETTEAGDTKLGDCVKTLCEGYNGGKNLPSSPLVVPQGAISSRLAALLAYANETTGAGDTTMGDAIRTLCEGYGGGELIFYEKLIGDGTAYIDTKHVPTTALKYICIDCISKEQNTNVAGCRNATTSNNNLSFYIGSLNRTATYSIFYRNIVNYNYGTTAENGWTIKVEEIETGYDVTTKAATLSSGSTRSITKYTNVPNCSFHLFSVNTNGKADTNGSGHLEMKRFELVDGSTSLHLVPCTYNGEAGMWDLVSQTFFGNAASSGQFTVEGEIVYYDRLIGDGTAYIDLGQPITANDRFDFGFKHNVANTNSMFGVKSSSSSRFDVNGRNGTNYKNLQLQYRSNTNRSIALANNLGQYSEGYIDLATLSAEFDGVASTFPDATATFPTSNLHLFTARATIFNGYFSHFKWSRSGDTVMDLKPCTYNGEAGMWDMVGWKFYGNSNTSGAFTAENDN